MKDELLWEEGNPLRENHSKDLRCINPKCAVYQIEDYDLGRLTRMAIGVKKAPDSSINGAYAMIVSCPRCGTDYWWHIRESIAQGIKEEKFNTPA